jgi:hypothetical protein
MENDNRKLTLRSKTQRNTAFGTESKENIKLEPSNTVIIYYRSGESPVDCGSMRL